MTDLQSDNLPLLPDELMRSYRAALEKGLGLVFQSRSMRQIRSSLMEQDLHQTKVLAFVGAEGSGRSTLARLFHLSGPRWWRPFIEVDLSGEENERAVKRLCGYREGHLFSSEKKEGLLTTAAHSTLCLKNFDGYSRAIQEFLARIGSEGRYSPVNEKEEKEVTCRLVVTLQSHPGDLYKWGRISDGVRQMVSEHVVGIPPLAKRKDDVSPLAEKFMDDCCREFGTAPKKLSREAAGWLKKAAWSENIAQLKRGMYAACLNTKDALLYPHHFALAHDGNINAYREKQLEELSLQSIVEKKLESFLNRLGSFEAEGLHEAIVSRVEEPLIRLVLRKASGNQIKASRILGINRNTLRTKLAKYRIARDEVR